MLRVIACLPLVVRLRYCSLSRCLQLLGNARSNHTGISAIKRVTCITLLSMTEWLQRRNRPSLLKMRFTSKESRKRKNSWSSTPSSTSTPSGNVWDFVDFKSSVMWPLLTVYYSHNLFWITFSMIFLLPVHILPDKPMSKKPPEEVSENCRNIIF